ncbi:MAG TPA: DUF1295 domain-containing protein [Steroidobacteraceae bacterium]|jgi:steroid 5-alpha reductase family enzyme
MWSDYAEGLFWLACLALAAWLLSLIKRNVGIVDSVWSLMFLSLGVWLAERSPFLTLRADIVLALLCLWSLRLSIYITARNFGKPEDSRYRAIRARHQPYFDFKSLYLVFLLQALLAWVIALPLWGALSSVHALGVLDACGTCLVGVGIAFETVGDWQLARFKKDPANHDRVMDRGLWRYTRHPNYFGDFCVWWGFYLFALSAGAWWSLLGPLLMSVLLMRVSGVALLEKTIGRRRPEYQDYVRRTNAFFPGPPRS